MSARLVAFKGERARGFSLFELLIAVVIVAIGILGIASLQVISLQQNRAALYRAEALQIGNDILDRMRTNPEIVGAANVYAPVLLTAPPAAGMSCIGAGQNCTPAQMRDFDVAQWKCSITSVDGAGVTFPVCDLLGITGRLPGGAGSITEVDGVHTVRVQWIDDSQGNIAFVQMLSRMD